VGKWLLLALLPWSSTARADASFIGGDSARLAPCTVALAAVLRSRYARSDDGQGREHSCEVDTRRPWLTFHCHGACNDRNCHDDGCIGYDSSLDVSLAPHEAAEAAWTRDRHLAWRTSYTRRHGGVEAELVQYGAEHERRAPESRMRRLRETIDRCLEARATDARRTR
jgi:hypothetical protein